MADGNDKNREIEQATRQAVRDILVGAEGQMLMSRVAEEAARQTITDFMLKIGMDTTSPQAVIALQADMQHLRWWNKTVSSGGMRAIMIAIAMAATSGWGVLFAGLRAYLETK